MPVRETPVQSKTSKSAADLAERIDAVGERELQAAGERDGNAGGERDRRIPGIGVEDHPQRGRRRHRKLLIDRDRNGLGGGRAVVIADGERLSGAEIEAGDMAVGANKIGRREAAQGRSPRGHPPPTSRRR